MTHNPRDNLPPGPGPGRPKGSRDRETIAREASKSGSTPLEFYLAIMRGEPIVGSFKIGKNGKPTKQRVTWYPTKEDQKWAAQVAGPFCHPKLQAVANVTGDQMKSHEDWIAQMDTAAAEIPAGHAEPLPPPPVFDEDTQTEGRA